MGELTGLPGVPPGANRSRPRPEPRRRPATAARSNADYRLRGLDLDAVDADHPPVMTTRDRKRSESRRPTRAWLSVAVIAVLIGVSLRAFMVQPFSVTSASMLPTLQVGDRVLVVRLGPVSRSVKGGDIVVFHRPRIDPCARGRQTGQDLVERVIALPGEAIRSAGGRIYLNGMPLHEPRWYNVKSGEVGRTPIPLTKVPPNGYFVMNDNRKDACDSRLFGVIPRTSVIGRVILVVVHNGTFNPRLL